MASGLNLQDAALPLGGGDDVDQGQGEGGGGYRLEVMICELVLWADDELNNGEELKGLAAAANLWPPHLR